MWVNRDTGMVDRWDFVLKGENVPPDHLALDGLEEVRQHHARRRAGRTPRTTGSCCSPTSPSSSPCRTRSSPRRTRFASVSPAAAPAWPGPRWRRSAPRRSARPSPGPPITAASPSTPVGSTMIFIRSHTKRSVARSSSSDTVTMSATRARMIGKVSAPSDGVRAPSAIVPRVVHRLQRAAAERAVAVVPRLGLHADDPAARAAARAPPAPTPTSSPPPPQGTTSASSAPDLVEQLQGRRALPRDDVGMVEGRDQHHRRRRAWSPRAIASRSSVAGS